MYFNKNYQPESKFKKQQNATMITNTNDFFTNLPAKLGKENKNSKCSINLMSKEQRAQMEVQKLQ